MTVIGFEEPLSCTKAICTKDIIKIKKGKKKCKPKNLLSVASLIEKPPHKRNKKSPPIRGKAENKLEITIAPQKLIWPQGKI